MTIIPFLKMHGAGNDFVIIDGRQFSYPLEPHQIALIADRQRGVGCDQLIVVKNSIHDADAHMYIYNSDGSSSGTCGNATRCVASLLMEELKKDFVTIETKGGMLSASKSKEMPKLVAVDMGEPRLKWDEIPLAKEVDTLHLPVSLEEVSDPVAVSMGNPHVVFFVPDAAAIDLARLGSQLEHHPLFPEKANISFAQVTSRSSITLRVWERGTGATLACGSAACAVLVAAVRRNLTDRKAAISLPGGVLHIEWHEANNRITMTGPVAVSFSGVVDNGLLG